MKKLHLLLIFMVVIQTSHAQQLVPASEPVSMELLNSIKAKSDSLKILKHKIKEEESNSTLLGQFEKLKKDLANLRSKGSSVYFYGLSTLSSSEDLSTAYTASGRLAVKVMPIRALSLTLGINAINVDPQKGVDKDSLDVKALLFPETGNFGILFNPSLLLYSTTPIETDLDENSTNVVYHSWSFEGSFAYRNNLVNFKGNDTLPEEKITFENVNWTAGFKYSYFKRIDKENNISFSLTAYYSAFNVPQEGVANFYKVLNDPIFKEKNTRGVINGFGAKTEVQYNNFILFADVRYCNPP